MIMTTILTPANPPAPILQDVERPLLCNHEPKTITDDVGDAKIVRVPLSPVEVIDNTALLLHYFANIGDALHVIRDNRVTPINDDAAFSSHLKDLFQLDWKQGICRATGAHFLELRELRPA